MNILIVKLSAIGDVVQSLPFLEVLRRAYPQARLTWLVEEAAAEIVAGHPELDRVVVSRRRTWVQGLKRAHLSSVLRDMRQFWRELRAEEYDLVVDLQGLLRSGILTLLSGGRRRVGFDRTRELSYLFLNERLEPYDPDRHALRRYLDAAAYLGAVVEAEPKLRLPPQPEAAARAEGFLAGTARPRVVLNPAAKWPSKLWPQASWIEFGRRLVQDLGLQVILTGGPEDQVANQALARGIGNVLDLSGRTDLKVLAEVFRRAEVVVCPDTGPMHLAAAVETPVVALFGPTAPWRTGPFGDGHTVVRLGLECSPCFRRRCRDPRCLTGLPVSEVLGAVSARLEKRALGVQRPAY